MAKRPSDLTHYLATLAFAWAADRLVHLQEAWAAWRHSRRLRRQYDRYNPHYAEDLAFGITHFLALVLVLILLSPLLLALVVVAAPEVRP